MRMRAAGFPDWSGTLRVESFASYFAMEVAMRGSGVVRRVRQIMIRPGAIASAARSACRQTPQPRLCHGKDGRLQGGIQAGPGSDFAQCAATAHADPSLDLTKVDAGRGGRIRHGMCMARVARVGKPLPLGHQAVRRFVHRQVRKICSQPPRAEILLRWVSAIPAACCPSTSLWQAA